MKLGSDPAFPTSIASIQHGPAIGDLAGGVTKRELFAAMLLQGMASNPWLLKESIQAAAINVTPPSMHKMAVQSADALLIELAKPVGKTE